MTTQSTRSARTQVPDRPAISLPELPSYYDSPEFKTYAAQVLAVIVTFKGRGTATRDIHTALGDRARREWTLDAIDSLHGIEPVGLHPVRYRHESFRYTGSQPDVSVARTSVA